MCNDLDKRCFQPEQTVTVPLICLNDLDHTGEPHEPPIGFLGGSLYMSWDLQITESSFDSGPRPYKYVLVNSDVHKGDIAVVKVMTEGNDGHATFRRYLLPRQTRARLLIWLHQLTNDSPPYPARYENKTSEPQILLKGSHLLIESDKRLQASYATYKNKRRFGIAHPGYDRHFRIAAWAIVTEGGELVTENNDPFGLPFTHTGGEGYQIYVSFHHEHND